MIYAQGHVMEGRYGSPAERLLLQRWIWMQGPYMGCANGKRAKALDSCFGVIVDRTRESQCRCSIEEEIRQVT